MKMFRRKTMLLAGLALIFSTTSFAEEKKAEEKEPELVSGASTDMLVNTCAGCHGPNGVSAGPSIPTLAGMSPAYLIDMMEGYKSGDKPSTIMGRMAKGYTSEEFAQMGDYFSKQKYAMATQESNAEKAEKGAELHEKYCEKCHAEGGSLAEDEAGFLRGQWKSYTKAQIMDFQNGDRKAPKKMAKALKKLHKKEGPAGIEALVEYYSSSK